MPPGERPPASGSVWDSGSTRARRAYRALCRDQEKDILSTYLQLRGYNPNTSSNLSPDTSASSLKHLDGIPDWQTSARARQQDLEKHLGTSPFARKKDRELVQDRNA